MARRPVLTEGDGEQGSAVVDFVMVSMLIVTLLLAVLQVAVYVHVRNVVTASAQAGARYAANADVDSSTGAPRTVEIVARATSAQTAEGLACTSAEEVDASGLVLAILVPFRTAIVAAVTEALNSVTTGG